MQRSYKFTITKKDNLRYNFFLTRKRLFSTALLTVALMGGMLALIRYTQGTSPKEAIIGGVLIGIGGALLFLTAGIVSTVLRINNLYKSGSLKDFDVTFTVDMAGIHAKSDSGDADLPWERVRQIRETRKDIYVFYAKGRANVMPKCQLSREDVASLRTQIGKCYLAAREKAQKKG